MKIIGRTEEGARLVEMATEEMIALLNAAQALKRFSLCCQIGNAAPQNPPPVDEPISKRRPARKQKRAAEKRDKPNRHKTCEICGKAFMDKSKTNSRKVCDKKSCKHEQIKRYQRNWFRTTHGVKNPRKSVDNGAQSVDCSINPADPGLTDEQRETLKAKRLGILKTLAEKHKNDSAL